MLEKTAQREIVIYKEDGKMLMRLPGGEIVPYDNRFTDCPVLYEGNSFVKTMEDTDERP